jgi:hypothetical protein
VTNHNSLIKAQLLGVSAALAYKSPCRCATTGPIALAGYQTIDGVMLQAGDSNLRVLVKSQADATQNGIYDAQAGNWPRSADFSQNDDAVKGTRFLVAYGATQSGVWALQTPDPVIVRPGQAGPASQIVFTTDVVGQAAPLVADLANITPAQGDVFYIDAGGHLVNLPAGANTQVLATGGPAANPRWLSLAAVAYSGLASDLLGVVRPPNLPGYVEDLALMSLTLGDMLYFDGAHLARLAAGASGQFLKTAGTTAPPAWATLAAIASLGSASDLIAGTIPTARLAALLQTLANLVLTQGDVLYHNGTTIVVLAPGTAGQFLQTQGAGANPQWASALQAARNLGDVASPSASRTTLGAATLVQTDSISGLIPVVNNGDVYALVINLPWDITVTQTTTICTAGSCTATWSNIGANFTNPNSVSTVEDIQTQNSCICHAGTDITLTISNRSNCLNLSFTVQYTFTLN